MTLASYIAARLGAPFCWGSHDCVLFALQSGGEDLCRATLAGIPPWRTARQAARSIKAVGGLVPAFDARLPRVPPNFAVDGDIGMYNGSMGVFSGAHLVCPGTNKLEFVDRTLCGHAWKYKGNT